MMSDETTTIHIDFNDGIALRYVISAASLADARDRAHEMVPTLKAGARKMPDFEKVDRKKVDGFVADCALLCIASEKRGKGIFKGTAISDFHLLDGVDLPPYGTA